MDETTPVYDAIHSVQTAQRLRVIMLGRLEIGIDTFRNGDATRRPLLPPATARSQSLLAYLILHRGAPQSREVLAEMFWPDRPRSRARRSLATALWHIRRSFAPDDPLQSDRRFVQLVFPGQVSVDAEEFEAAVKTAAHVDALQQAVDRYEGEFLPGFYDDWVIRRREWLQSLYQRALLRLMRQREAADDNQGALKAALQALAVDPCCEEAHRGAMRTYWRLGQHRAALAQYQRCQQALADGLSSPPAQETTDLYRALQTQGAPASHGARPVLPPFPEPTQVLAPRRPAGADDVPPLVGRDAETALLQDRWRETVASRGGAIFLCGEAGIGKTRLLTTLGEYVQRRGGRVLAVRCHEHERGQLYGPMVDLLQAALTAGGDALIREMPAWQVASLARLAPEVTEFVPADSLSPLPAGREERHLINALTGFLIRLARRTPLLLLIDDLQWAPESTLAWLPSLARRIATEPLLLVGAYRLEEAPPEGLLAQVVARLESETNARRVTLPRLSPQDLAAWLPGLDEKRVAQLHRHTDGNPFFVVETLRALAKEGKLEERDGRYRATDQALTLPLSERVRQTIKARLERQSPPARQGLAVAAVIGRIFDLDVWMAVWGLDEETELETLDELLRGRLLREGEGPFSRDYEFDHHLVQEAVYQNTPRRRRQQLHSRTARVLEKMRGGEPGLGAEIAFHYLRAGQPDQARPWLLEAGDQAVAMAATSEALEYYRQVLAGYPRGEEHAFPRAMLERKLGDVFFQRGEYGPAERHLLHALDLLGRPFPAPGLGLSWSLARALVRQMAHRLTPWSSRRDETAPPALREEIAAYISLGWIYSLQARYTEYLLVSLRALNASEAAGYKRGVAVAATALGIAADFMGRFGWAAHFHRQAQAVVSGVSEPGDAGFVAFGQAYHAYLTGDEETLFAQARLAAEKYRAAGDAHRWILATVLQAYVFAYRGRLDEVARCASDLVRAGEEMDDLEAACAGASLAGLAARLEGDWTEAIQRYQQATDLANAIPDYMNLVENLAGLVRCYAGAGRWEAMEQTLAIAEQAAREHEVMADVRALHLLSAFDAHLRAAMHMPEERDRWLARAKPIMEAARGQARAFRPAEPELWRLCGRYAWLRGKPDAARIWWEKSLAKAEEMGHRIDWGATALEMGLRLDDPSLQAQGQTKLEGTGAVGEIIILEQDLIPNPRV